MDFETIRAVFTGACKATWSVRAFCTLTFFGSCDIVIEHTKNRFLCFLGANLCTKVRPYVILAAVTPEDFRCSVFRASSSEPVREIRCYRHPTVLNPEHGFVPLLRGSRRRPLNPQPRSQGSRGLVGNRRGLLRLLGSLQKCGGFGFAHL